jgi:hypothetical protein
MSADDWLIPVHRRARALLNVDRPHEAGKHLARALRRLDPVLAPPQPLLISVAALFAGTPFPGIDATSRFEWGRYAHRASTRFPNDLRLLITAADAYEQVLGEYGLTFDVMLVRRQRLASQQRHGTEADIVLAQRDLALALHGDGWCHEARTVIHAACGRRDQAISILRGNARLLPVPGTEAAARAAEWLAGAEKHHPRICEDPQQPDITQTSGDRVLFWLTAIATHYQHPPMHCSDIIVPDPHRSQP